MDHEVGQLAERQRAPGGRGARPDGGAGAARRRPGRPSGHGGRARGRGGPPDRGGGGVRGRAQGGHRGRGGRSGPRPPPACPPTWPSATSGCGPTWAAWGRPGSSATGATAATSPSPRWRWSGSTICRPTRSPPARSATGSWSTDGPPDRIRGAVLILVRHGESTGNAEGLLLGRIDSPLTARGLEQARSLADTVAGANRLISSPLARARDTAEALGHRPARRDRRAVDRGGLRRVTTGRSWGTSPPRCGGAGGPTPPSCRPVARASPPPGPGCAQACEELFADPDGAGPWRGHGGGGQPRVADQGRRLLVARHGRRRGVAPLPGQRVGHPDHLGAGRPGAGRVQPHALVVPGAEAPVRCQPSRRAAVRAIDALGRRGGASPAVPQRPPGVPAGGLVQRVEELGGPGAARGRELGARVAASWARSTDRSCGQQGVERRPRCAARAWATR